MYDNALFRADCAAGLTTVATCWRAEPPGRPPILGTDCAQDVVITETDAELIAIRPSLNLVGRYTSYRAITPSDIHSTSDLAVTNMEVESILKNSGELLPGISAADIEAGVMNGVLVHVFAVNWMAPDRWQKTRVYGNFGEFRPDSDGRYTAEIRSLLQRISQVVGDTFSTSCIVKRFGDARCKFDVASVTRTGIVTAVSSRKNFTVALTPATDPPIADYFSAGALKFTSGENNGFEKGTFSVSVLAGVATVTMWEEMPADIQIGDTLTLEPRCNRTEDDCKMHDNFINMQAYGLRMKGVKELLRGGKGIQSTDLNNTLNGSAFGNLP